MPPLSTVDRCKLVGDRLKEAKANGDLTAELELQIRLDQLLDRLHAEQTEGKSDARSA